MQHHLELPKNPGATATQILESLPDRLGAERSAAIIDHVKRGCIPDFLCHWREIQFTELGHNVSIFCLPDFLCLGTDQDWVFTPVGAITAEAVATLLNAHLPTPHLVDVIYQHSVKQVAKPWGPPYDQSMTYTSRWSVQTKKIANSSTFYAGSTNEGHLKNVCVSKRMEDKKGEWLSFYGWFKGNGKPIQGNNVDAHGAEYADYAHGARFIFNEVLIDGQKMQFDDVLKHETLYKLFEPTGCMKYGTYHACRAAFGVTLVKY